VRVTGDTEEVTVKSASAASDTDCRLLAAAFPASGRALGTGRGSRSSRRRLSAQLRHDAVGVVARAVDVERLAVLAKRHIAAACLPVPEKRGALGEGGKPRAATGLPVSRATRTPTRADSPAADSGGDMPGQSACPVTPSFSAQCSVTQQPCLMFQMWQDWRETVSPAVGER
jgi:hypothetical protein